LPSGTSDGQFQFTSLISFLSLFVILLNFLNHSLAVKFAPRQAISYLNRKILQYFENTTPAIFLPNLLPPAVSSCRDRPCRRSGDPPRLCLNGKRKLTESSREFPKASVRQNPEGSLREAQERRQPDAALLPLPTRVSKRAPDGALPQWTLDACRIACRS